MLRITRVCSVLGNFSWSRNLLKNPSLNYIVTFNQNNVRNVRGDFYKKRKSIVGEKTIKTNNFSSCIQNALKWGLNFFTLWSTNFRLKVLEDRFNLIYHNKIISIFYVLKLMKAGDKSYYSAIFTEIFVRLAVLVIYESRIILSSFPS